MSKLRVKKKKTYIDPKGREIPAVHMKNQNILRDYVASTLSEKFIQLHNLLVELKDEGFELMEQYQERLANMNKAPISEYGNITASSFDGSAKIEVDSHPFMDFGEGLKQAHQLMMDVITDATQGIDPQIKLVVLDAFRVKRGQVSATKVLSLAQFRIKHPKWKQALKIINDSQGATYRRKYIRCKIRTGKNDDWQTVPLDIAKVREKITK